MAESQPAPPDRLPDWEAFYRDYRKPGYVPGFELTTKLGGGAFGIVFRARKESIGKDYAIKFLRVEDREVRQAVLHELEQVKYFAQIDHPNLVQIEDRGEVSGIPYLVMQFAGTETLRNRLSQGGPPAAEQRDELLRYFLQACRGVAALHERGLVHFDLKPANVFLKGPVARVGDYGLSKLVTHSRGSLTMGRGTPYYMSPEMLQRRGDHRSDIYSLGVMLYEILCGELPFTGDSEWEVLKKHEQEQPGWPAHLTPTDLGVLQRCLQKDPAARFESVHDLITALGAPAGVAAAAWDDVQHGAFTREVPPPPPFTPPPLPDGGAGEDAGEDPYAGFRTASREAYRHARKIAKDAFAAARDASRRASRQASSVMGERMREARELHQRKWRHWRDDRRRRRAERRAARQAARAAAATPQRGRGRWLFAAVPGALILFVLVSGAIWTMRAAERPRAFVHRNAAVASEVSSIAAASKRSGAVVTFPGVSATGEHYLFDQWSVPANLASDVATREPSWVETFRRDPERARHELDQQWYRLRSKAPYRASQRSSSRSRKVSELPTFELFRPDEDDLARVRELMQAPDYDRELARKLARHAPQSLAIAARELDRLRYRDWDEVKAAQRLERLLIDATGFDAIEFAYDRKMNLDQVASANRQLGQVWLWFLHEVGITDRAWETWERLRER